MGCWAIGGPWTMTQPGERPFAAGWGKTDDRESIRAIHAALDAGVALFDTAASYGAGHSERILGQALRGRRDQAVIATKFGHLVNEADQTVYPDDTQILANVRSDVENSLRRLGTDWIDIYQLHQAAYDPELAVELRGALEELVQAGKIRWYGWSTDQVDRAEIFAKGEHCTSIQFKLNALLDNAEMRRFCADAELAGIIRDPLHRGMLAGKFTSATTFPKDDIRSRTDYSSEQIVRELKTAEALQELLRADGRSMAQGALAYIWALDPHLIPIPGFKTVAQVRENAGAMDFGPLDPASLAQIRAIVAERRSMEE
jgi:aryl-alcohol dehydrogenase-like predicted oxidoreductase